MNPAHIDGCSVVVLKPTNNFVGKQFTVVVEGEFSFDGESLILRLDDGSEIAFPHSDLADLKVVHPESKIPECHGFNFFLVRDN